MNKKFLITAVSISIGVLILVLLLSPKKNVSSKPLSPSEPTSLSNIIPVNLSDEKRNQTIIYTDTIEGKLPLGVEEFDTSVGIFTTINISRSNTDPAEIVHLDITGLSYINKNELDEAKNPNLTAFKESYLKAIELLESQNIDPKKLLFVFSDRSYVNESANYWVDQLKLRE